MLPIPKYYSKSMNELKLIFYSLLCRVIESKIKDKNNDFKGHLERIEKALVEKVYTFESIYNNDAQRHVFCNEIDSLETDLAQINSYLK